MLNVVNVGQGDCFILRPRGEGCIHNKKTFIIDLGDGKNDITKNLGNKDLSYHLILTHSHKDHIGGLKYFVGEDFDKITDLTLPLYHNEVVIIANSILKLEGISKLKESYGLIEYLNEIVSTQKVLQKITRLGKPNITFAYEGENLCNHIEVYNPPVKIVDSGKNFRNEKNVNRMLNLFDKRYRSQIEWYYIMSQNGNDNFTDSPSINDLILSDYNHKNINNSNYVFDFFMKNIDRIEMFNTKPTMRRLYSIIAEYELTSNQVSIVFKYNYGKSILFTGDADKKVLKRIIEAGYDIQSDYLKVPHHGSKNNLNKFILNKIKPKKAIISHGNAKFGRAKDTHPNKEVIDMINKEKIDLIVTNDIIKNNKTIFNRNFDNKEDKYVKVVGCD
ncbi:MBL fold metallo-hydrolase [Clostridium gasigenes]|uniref:ComEC/Rec2 family competence protein n=1 Tax=Clostridium gasigenes TaxID=94869 RepID=UPI0016281DD2|nr:MBL fold metallo-hydrolase [Clostridium gasigenes]MBB6624820.1 MBL fold metallo-hydrolase [Clostridium gasigenes]